MFLLTNLFLGGYPPGGPGETRTPEKLACKASAIAARRQAHVRPAGRLQFNDMLVGW